MYPSECLGMFVKKYVTRNRKITFISALVVGVLAHGYMLTNKLPNYNDINCMMNDYGVGIELGRWMLCVLGNVVKYTIGNYSLPWLYGLISIVILGLAAVLVVDLFRIENPLLCFLTAGIMVSFPVVTGILFFMFTAPYYILALAFSVLAVRYVGGKGMKKWLIGTGILVCVLGVYQAYFCFAAVLCLLLLMLHCMEAEDSKEWTAIMKEAIRYFLFLLIAIIVYLICVRIFLWVKGVQLSEYQGLDGMGNLSLMELPGLVIRAYKNYGSLFWGNVDSINPYWIIKIMIIALHILSIVGFAEIMVRKPGIILAEFLLLTALFPLAVNLIYIMVPNGYVYSIMLYAVVSIYILPILLLNISKGRRGDCLKHWIGVVCIAGIILLQCQYDNMQYFSAEIVLKQAQSYNTTLITQIKSVSGYEPDMPVVFLGSNIEDSSFDSAEEIESYNMGGRGSSLINIYCRNNFLKRYFGFAEPIIQDNGDWYKREDVQNMPKYPSEGSIMVIDETVVVKFEDRLSGNN